MPQCNSILVDWSKLSPEQLMTAELNRLDETFRALSVALYQMVSLAVPVLSLLGGGVSYLFYRDVGASPEADLSRRAWARTGILVCPLVFSTVLLTFMDVQNELSMRGGYRAYLEERLTRITGNSTSIWESEFGRELQHSPPRRIFEFFVVFVTIWVFIAAGMTATEQWKRVKNLGRRRRRQRTLAVAFLISYGLSFGALLTTYAVNGDAFTSGYCGAAAAWHPVERPPTACV